MTPEITKKRIISNRVVGVPPSVYSEPTPELFREFPELYEMSKSFITKSTSWTRGWSPVASVLTAHVDDYSGTAGRNWDDVSGWINPDVLRKYPAYAWINCDDIEDVEEEERQRLKDLGPMKFKIRMRGNSGNVPSTKSAPIPFGGLVIPYDAESSWKVKIC